MTRPILPTSLIVRLWHDPTGFHAVVVVLSDGETFSFDRLEDLHDFLRDRARSPGAAVVPQSDG